jgi:hypothetical protein
MSALSPDVVKTWFVESLLKAKAAGMVSGLGQSSKRGASFALLERPWRG